jgi:hypothetical protein
MTRHETYGYQVNEARIYVDGKLAGRSIFILLPRDNLPFNFHEMCDTVSQELQETGCAFLAETLDQGCTLVRMR